MNKTEYKITKPKARFDKGSGMFYFGCVHFIPKRKSERRLIMGKDFRDEIALEALKILMNQTEFYKFSIEQIDRFIPFNVKISYQFADEMIKARDGK